MSFKIGNPGSYLQKALLRKKKENPLYSLRSLARDLKVSASFLSNVFSGQKPLPLKHLRPICQRLDLDLKEERALAEAFGLVKPEKSKKSSTYELLSQDRASIFTDWYYPAICDLATCSDFRSDPRWIARRLGISTSQAEAAIQTLLYDRHLQLQEGVLKKSAEKLRLPTQKFLPVLRNFHQKWLQKVKDIIQTQTDHEAFSRRSVQAITLAGNPEKLRKAQQVLTDALYKAADILGEGECTQIYHVGTVQVQLTTDIDQKEKP